MKQSHQLLIISLLFTSIMGACFSWGKGFVPELPPVLMSVETPAYNSKISGATKVSLIAPGMDCGVVQCWKPGSGFGSDSVVSNLTFDDTGKAVFTFPADEYPHGPITMRITSTDGYHWDSCNLMLYNKGGIAWNEGIPDIPPPQTEGMKVIFQNDFRKPLSISSTGRGTTYCSHKPGGGDFGSFRFADYESTNSPFAQMDTYLRIRANASDSTTGFISSVGMNGKGITANAPCYFECRLLAPSATGSWPAFWLVNLGALKGPKEPSDEIDIIEGYGGIGRHRPNANGYQVASHTWNQVGKQPGVYLNILMKELGGGATWWETFHTYGCKITKTDTIYYCDNIEVARHPTTRLGKSDSFFFMINLALGGGWPVDLSRYDGRIDMYIDYVRVWQG